MINGKRETWEFKSDDDVYKVIDLIIEETQEFNKTSGKSFDISESVVSQMPFFACTNVLANKDIQKDIKRYLYCEKFNVPPYDGGYGNQPYLWVEKVFLIRKYLAKMESKKIKQAKEK